MFTITEYQLINIPSISSRIIFNYRSPSYCVPYLSGKYGTPNRPQPQPAEKPPTANSRNQTVNFFPPTYRPFCLCWVDENDFNFRRTVQISPKTKIYGRRGGVASACAATRTAGRGLRPGRRDADSLTGESTFTRYVLNDDDDDGY